jgi:hypothetical protein
MSPPPPLVPSSSGMRNSDGRTTNDDGWEDGWMERTTNTEQNQGYYISRHIPIKKPKRPKERNFIPNLPRCLFFPQDMEVQKSYREFNQSNWGCWVEKKRICGDRETTMENKLVVVKEHVGTLHSWVCLCLYHSFTRCTEKMFYIHSFIHYYSLLLLANAFLAQSQRPGGSPKGFMQVERFPIFLWVWCCFWLSYGWSYCSLKLKTQKNK